MRCAWCHNPETQSSNNEILFDHKKCISCGACSKACKNGAHQLTDYAHVFNRKLCSCCLKCVNVCCSKALIPSFTEKTTDEILDEVKKDMAFYGTNGGITLSGGEPLIQPHEAIDLLKKCKKSNIGTAIETSGCFDSSFIPDLISYTDCFLWDFKDGNDERHKKYTGVSNVISKKNLLLADSLGAKTVLRCIMIKDVNMDEEHYTSIADLWHRLNGCQYVELIPYHAYGGSKMLQLGKKDNGNHNWIPSNDDLEKAKTFLKNNGVFLK